MIIALAVILAILLYAVGGERGILTFLTLCWNIAVLSLSIIMISWGWEPITITFLSCLLICSATLFYQNGRNAKTFSAFWSVILILVLLVLPAYFLGLNSHIQGLNELMLREDEIMGLTPNININIVKIAVSMMITGLIGAATDTSMAISSAVYEVFRNNRQLSPGELFQSGIHIGRDVLGTTVNTLYFACIGESMMMFLLFKSYHYSFWRLINSKAFFQEFTDIMFSCLACILVIPLSAAVTSWVLKRPEKFRRFLDEDELFLYLKEDGQPGQISDREK